MNRLFSTLLAALVAAALLVISTDVAVASESEEAESHHQAITVGFQERWHVAAGLSGGGLYVPGSFGGFAGVQVSVVRMQTDFWKGGFADVHYDFGQASAFNTVLGFEAGYRHVGFDVGAAMRVGDDGVAFGPQGRLLLTAGLLSLFGRYKYWPTRDEHVAQVGLLLKIPLMAPWGYEPRR